VKVKRPAEGRGWPFTNQSGNAFNGPPPPSKIQNILSASLSCQQHTLNLGERKKFQVFSRLKNPRRPVEPVEFAPVEFLSVSPRAENKIFAMTDIKMKSRRPA